MEGMTAIFAVKMIVGALKFELVSYLETHPMFKYKIDRFFYNFNVKLYYPFFSYGFPIYCIIYSLFAPDYDSLPRFTAACIAWCMGLVSALVFSYLRKQLTPPQKPICD